ILQINVREIIVGQVKYSTIYKEIQNTGSLFLKLPKFLQTIFWWLAILSYGIAVLVIPFGLIYELTKLLKYNKWKKENYWMYEEWIEKLVKEGRLDSYKDPTNLPYTLWKEYPYPIPTLPNNDLKSMIIG